MAHRIETSYLWLINYEDSTAKLVFTYGFRGFVFTFDEVDDKDNTLEVQEIANEQPALSYEELYRQSGYLVMEECHPCLFEMDIENPEKLPVD